MTHPHWDRLVHFTRQGDPDAAAALKTEAARRGDLPHQTLAATALRDMQSLVYLGLEAQARSRDAGLCAWAETVGISLQIAHISHIEALMAAANAGRTVRLVGWSQVLKALASARLSPPEAGVSMALEHGGRFTAAVGLTRTSACMVVYLADAQTLTLGIQVGPSGSPSPPGFWPSLRPWRKDMSQNLPTLRRWATEQPLVLPSDPSLHDRLSLACIASISPPQQTTASPATPEAVPAALKKLRECFKKTPCMDDIISHLRLWPAKAAAAFPTALQEAEAAVSQWPPQQRVLYPAEIRSEPTQPWDTWFRHLQILNDAAVPTILAHPSVALGHIRTIEVNIPWADVRNPLPDLLPCWPVPLDRLDVTTRNTNTLHTTLQTLPAHPIADLRLSHIDNCPKPPKILIQTHTLTIDKTTNPTSLVDLLRWPEVASLRALHLTCTPNRADTEPPPPFDTTAFAFGPLSLAALDLTLEFPPHFRSDNRVKNDRHFRNPMYPVWWIGWLQNLLSAGQNPQTLRSLTLSLFGYLPAQHLAPALCDLLCQYVTCAASLTHLTISTNTAGDLSPIANGADAPGFRALLTHTLPSLQHLTFQRLGLPDACIELLANAPTPSALETLDLSDNLITTDGFSYLYQSPGFSNLRSLSLHKNALSFPKALKKNLSAWKLRALTHLDLSNTGCTPKCLSTLAALLADPNGLPMLKTLSLAGCRLGAPAAKIFAQSPIFSALDRIDLTDCNFGPPSINLIQSQPWTYGRVVGLTSA